MFGMCDPGTPETTASSAITSRRALWRKHMCGNVALVALCQVHDTHSGLCLDPSGFGGGGKRGGGSRRQRVQLCVVPTASPDERSNKVYPDGVCVEVPAVAATDGVESLINDGPPPPLSLHCTALPCKRRGLCTHALCGERIRGGGGCGKGRLTHDVAPEAVGRSNDDVTWGGVATCVHPSLVRCSGGGERGGSGTPHVVHVRLAHGAAVPHESRWLGSSEVVPTAEHLILHRRTDWIRITVSCGQTQCSHHDHHHHHLHNPHTPRHLAILCQIPLLSARTLLDFCSFLKGFEEFLWAHHSWVTTATLAPMIGQGVATVALLVAVSLYAVVFLESGTQQVSHSPDPPSFCTPPFRHNILGQNYSRIFTFTHQFTLGGGVCW
jgi:hypothetical protein